MDLIPLEIFHHVIKYLDITDLCHLRIVCKSFNYQIDDSFIQKLLNDLEWRIEIHISSHLSNLRYNDLERSRYIENCVRYNIDDIDALLMIGKKNDKYRCFRCVDDTNFLIPNIVEDYYIDNIKIFTTSKKCKVINHSGIGILLDVVKSYPNCFFRFVDDGDITMIPNLKKKRKLSDSGDAINYRNFFCDMIISL